jgi:hypothetical protein
MTDVSSLINVGALGVMGGIACKKVTEFEGEEYPTEFLASTVNS